MSVKNQIICFKINASFYIYMLMLFLLPMQIASKTISDAEKNVVIIIRNSSVMKDLSESKNNILEFLPNILFQSRKRQDIFNNNKTLLTEFPDFYHEKGMIVVAFAGAKAATVGCAHSEEFQDYIFLKNFYITEKITKEKFEYWLKNLFDNLDDEDKLFCGDYFSNYVAKSTIIKKIKSSIENSNSNYKSFFTIVTDIAKPTSAWGGEKVFQKYVKNWKDFYIRAEKNKNNYPNVHLLTWQPFTNEALKFESEEEIQPDWKKLRYRFYKTFNYKEVLSQKEKEILEKTSVLQDELRNEKLLNNQKDEELEELQRELHALNKEMVETGHKLIPSSIILVTIIIINILLVIWFYRKHQRAISLISKRNKICIPDNV